MNTRTRLILSGLVFLLGLFACVAFDAAQGPIQGNIAVAQLNGGNAEYAAARAAATTSLIPMAIIGVVILLLLVMWLPPTIRLFRSWSGQSATNGPGQ